MGKSTMHEVISEVKTDIAVLKELMKKMDKAISGNGQPGLVQNLAANEEKLDKHVIKDTEWKGQKDGAILGIRWTLGIGFSAFTAAVAILATLI